MFESWQGKKVLHLQFLSYNEHSSAPNDREKSNKAMMAMVKCPIYPQGTDEDVSVFCWGMHCVIKLPLQAMGKVVHYSLGR